MAAVQGGGERGKEESIVSSASSQLHHMHLTEKEDDKIQMKHKSVADEKEEQKETTEHSPQHKAKDDEHSVLSSQHWGPERTVEVVRVPGHGLGISIVGGKIDPVPRKGVAKGSSSAAVTGIFIKNVLEGSPAGATGELCTGDRILEVDGHNLRKASHEKAVEIIRQSGNVVVFVVQSLLAYDDEDEEDYDEEEFHNINLQSVQAKEVFGENLMTDIGNKNMTTATLDNSESGIDSVQAIPPPGFENDYPEEASENSDTDNSALPLPPPPPPPLMEMGGELNENVYSKNMDKSAFEKDDSDFEEEPDESTLSGQVTLPNGIVIDRSSAAFLKKSKRDPEVEDDYGYTKMKVHRKYMKDSQEKGTPKLISLNKGTNGLGISLAGHKDRSQMAIYICGLNPLGNAARVGGLGKL